MDKHLTYEFEIQIFPQIQSNAHRKLDLYHLTLNKVGKNPDVRCNTSTAIRSNTWINQSIQSTNIRIFLWRILKQNGFSKKHPKNLRWIRFGAQELKTNKYKLWLTENKIYLWIQSNKRGKKKTSARKQFMYIASKNQ